MHDDYIDRIAVEQLRTVKVGGTTHIAHLDHLYCRIPIGRVAVHPSLGEAWGKSREEAERRIYATPRDR